MSVNEKTRTVRSAEDRIAELQAKIEGIKTRDQRRKAKREPAVAQALLAIKAVDRSLAAGPNAAMKAALQEARGTLTACVAVTGLVVPESTATTGIATSAAGKPRGRKKQAAA